MTKRMLLASSLLVAVEIWSPATFAQRQTAVGPGTIPLSPTGSANGVDMSASATTGTLSVGVPGGPNADIFSNNNPVGPNTVAVSTAASSQGNIVFNSGSTVFGAIGVTQPAGPFLLGISGGNAGATVNFLGPVFATTVNVLGTGTLNFNSGSVNISATNFAGDGVIQLAPNTTLIGALTNTSGANTGTLSLGNASVLNGAVGGATGLRAISVTGGSNGAGAAALITGTANAYTFNLGTNTLNVGGSLTIANGGPAGVINTTLASPTVYGNIRPTGSTNIGPTLLVNVAVPQTAFIPLGTQFNIVQTQTGTVQSGTNGSVVTVVKDPTNPLYTFTAVPAAGTVAGLVAIRTTGLPMQVPVTPPVGVVLPPTLPVAVPIVPVLVAVAPVAPPVIVAPPPVISSVVPTTPGTPTPVDVAPVAPVAPVPPPPVADIGNVLGTLNTISDPVTIVNAIAQFAPSAADLVAPLVTFQGTKQFQGMQQSHLDDSLCREVSSLEKTPSVCQSETQRAGWWGKAFGYVGNQGAKNSYQGYSSAIGGLMIAYDLPVGPETRVGASLGYARSSISSKPIDAHTSSDSYRAMIYVDHERGPLFVNGNLSFGWNEYSGTRSIVFPGLSRSASSSFSGQDYTAFASTGYHAKIEGFTVTPYVSLQYTHVDMSSYTEKGAGDINLKVRGRGDDFLESALGVKVSRAFRPLDDGITYVPELHASWLHELSNPKLSQVASLAAMTSPSFKTPGFRASANTLNLGAGITVLSCSCTANTWSVDAVYDYYLGSNSYSAHQGMLKFTRRF